MGGLVEFLAQPLFEIDTGTAFPWCFAVSDRILGRFQLKGA